LIALIDPCFELVVALRPFVKIIFVWLLGKKYALQDKKHVPKNENVPKLGGQCFAETLPVGN
jgi:hypothetical protein